MRTILYSTERVTANTLESFVFILFLLCFALVASGYVWTHGQDIPDQSTWKLLLKVGCTWVCVCVPGCVSRLVVGREWVQLVAVRMGREEM